MKIKYSPALNWLLFIIFFLFSQTVFSQEYENLLSEDYLQSVFQFKQGSQFKYIKCKKKTYPTCTYIWGVKSNKDATRLKYGLEPEGNKLQVIYAQGRDQKDFKNAIRSYSDAIKLGGLGVESVWSSKRNQLSFITVSNLIVHINIDSNHSGDVKTQATHIANHILKSL